MSAAFTIFLAAISPTLQNEASENSTSVFEYSGEPTLWVVLFAVITLASKLYNDWKFAKRKSLDRVEKETDRLELSLEKCQKRVSELEIQVKALTREKLLLHERIFELVGGQSGAHKSPQES